MPTARSWAAWSASAVVTATASLDAVRGNDGMEGLEMGWACGLRGWLISSWRWPRTLPAVHATRSRNRGGVAAIPLLARGRRFCEYPPFVMHDLRRFPRVPLGRPVEFSTKDDDLPVRMEGMGRDISLGGMFIETDLAAPTGANIQVHVTLPGAKHELTLPSIVRWSAKDGMGVQFGLLGARETHAITEFVKTKDSTP
jgi:hypothetical protein